MNQEMPLGLGKVLSPQVDPANIKRSVSNYLVHSDQLLEAVLDAAERGLDSEDLDASHRFGRIIELVEMYRAGVEELDGKLCKAGAEPMVARRENKRKAA